MSKINSFTDLVVWQEAHKLVLLIYTITKRFPRDEVFGLISQMRRAAVSITSNIAEGFGRRGKRDKIQFYFIARGSLSEIESQFFIAKDLGYLEQKDIDLLSAQFISTHRLLNAFLKSTNELS